MRNFSAHRGPNASHNGLQLLRAHLGLTQADLAQWLGTSRAAVAMDERAERYLPWKASSQLTPLFAVLPLPDGPAPVPTVPAPVLSADDRQKLGRRQREIALEAYPIEEQLARCEVRLAQARLWQQALPMLRAARPATDKLAQLWLDYFEQKAAATLLDDSGTPALLRLRLATLAFEKSEIDRLLAESAPPAPLA